MPYIGQLSKRSTSLGAQIEKSFVIKFGGTHNYHLS